MRKVNLFDYFLPRLAGFAFAFLGDLASGGGGVLANRLTASVKLMFNLKSIALGMMA